METKRKGLCINFDNDCKYADNEIPIELDISADFVCPECNRDLIELNEKKFWKKLNKKVAIAGVILLVVFGIYFGIIQLTKDVTRTIVETGVETGIDIIKNTINGNDENTSTDNEATTDSQLETTKKTYQKEVNKKEKENTQTTTVTQPPISTPTTWKTINLPNGDRYVGETKDGLMHGVGEFHFSARRIISDKDWKKRYAEAGDVLKGTWNEGSFSTGKLYDANGKFKETIIIGQR